MAIIKVFLDEIDNDCISCYLCSEIAPQVFDVSDKMVIKENVDFTKYDTEIRDAAESCPTDVIRIELSFT